MHSLILLIIKQVSFQVKLEVYYKSNLSGGLMSLLGLDCTRLSLLLIFHLDLTVCILYFFHIECLALCCLLCVLYAFR